MDVDLLCVFLLIQAHLCWSQNTIIAPSRPIIASVGSDVALPCQLDPVKDLRNTVVEWARPDLTPRYVHIRRDGLDFLLDQNSLYLGRTALSESRLQKGDMSLSLTKVRPSDGGTYRCYIPQMDTKAEVTLLVVSVAPPSVSLTKERSGSPVLRCESRGWYPEPELEWLDSEGTVLLRTEAQRGASDELFTVSSRLSVEQRLGNTFTCRVRQQESGQSREAQLILTDEFLEACASCSVAWVLFGLGLCLAAAAAAFVVWKFKINKTKTDVRDNKHEDCEEGLPMLKPQEKHHSEDQKLSEYQEDFEKMTEDLHLVNDMSEKLQETKKFLLELKETLHRHQYELRAEINETRKEIKSSMMMRSDTKKEKLEKLEEKEQKKLKEFQDIIENTGKEICKIDEMIRKTSEKKGKLELDVKQNRKRVEKEKKRLETRVQPETEQVEVEKEEQVKENVQNEEKKQENQDDVGEITSGLNTLGLEDKPVNPEDQRDGSHLTETDKSESKTKGAHFTDAGEKTNVFQQNKQELEPQVAVMTQPTRATATPHSPLPPLSLSPHIPPPPSLHSTSPHSNYAGESKASNWQTQR